MPPNKVANTVSPGRKPRSVQARVHAWLILLIWAPAIFYRERVAFNLAGASCQWPALDEGNGARSSDPSVHVAVVADPQLTTYLSYRELGRGNPGLIAVEGISDAYMSRAFRRAVLSNDPEHVLFLGDLIDQGERIVNPEEWHQARRRFDRIFRWPRRARSGDTHATGPLDNGDDGVSRDRERPVLYRTVHGNHDVGYSRFAVRLRHLYARHEEYFGSTNFVRRLGGVDLVGVGAMALDGADDPKARSAQTNETWEFVKSLESSGVFYVVNAVQLVSGLALLINRYVLMALAALSPVLLGILFFHATMEQSGLPFALILAALWATILSRYNPSLSALFSATSEARPSPSEGV